MQRKNRLSKERAFKTLKAGHIVWSVWGHVHTNRFTTPYTTRLEVYVRAQVLKGVRKHHDSNDGQFGHLLNGSWGPYFRRQKHAEAFAQEIRDGLHPQIEYAMEERDSAFDEVDELMGVCDRGLGIYDDVIAERERQYEQEEYLEEL